MRDPKDCTCPGARKFLGDVEVAPSYDHPDAEWRTNDPKVRCAVHPLGYDPKTGQPREKPAEKPAA